jgi:acid phosphatase family membrane protein YuiD
MPFVTLPVAAWIVCGSIKFAINFYQSGSAAFERIGHGGFPSNHTAIISSLMWAFGLLGEWQLAGLAVAVLMIHVFDATGLRREVGYHASAINQLSGSRLREIVGHRPVEIAGGLVVGLGVAVAYWSTGAIT